MIQWSFMPPRDNSISILDSSLSSVLDASATSRGIGSFPIEVTKSGTHVLEAFKNHPVLGGGEGEN